VSHGTRHSESVATRAQPAKMGVVIDFILTFGVGATAVMLVDRIEGAFGLRWVYGLVAALEVGLVLVATVLWQRSRTRLPRVANA